MLDHPGQAFHLLFRSKHRSGHYIWLDSMFTNMLDDEGVNAIVVNLINVTQSRRRKEELQKEIDNNADYKYALDESSIVAITDAEGTIQYVNDKFCQISRYSREELVGQNHRIVNSGFHSKEYIAAFWATISKGKIWNGEFKNRAKDGSLYWVNATVVPFLDETGKPYQYLSLRQDITRRKEAELEARGKIEESRVADIAEHRKTEQRMYLLNEELEERVRQRTYQLEVANSELESFSYSVSHDLRAPLRAINGYAKILEEDYFDIFDQEGKRLLKVVQDNAKRMGALIDDLLAFSRLGRKEMNKTVVPMKDVIENIQLEVCRAYPHRATIKLSTLHPLYADYTLITQVMTNLLLNAVKYSSKVPTPVIEISSTQKNGIITYCVRDNGAGFDMQYVHKLFNVFQRLHTTDEFEGTGVGLAIVQRIVNKHGGRVWAEGKTGEGAAFYFSLPEKN